MTRRAARPSGWGAIAALAVGVGAALWVARRPLETPRRQAAVAPPAAVGTPAAPRAAHTPRPLREVVFERTAERQERGRYLVNGLLQCFVCHSERDWSQPGAPPVAGKEGAGAVWWDKPWLVAPNLTPDEETGIGRWSDDMLARSIREGIAHDGRTLHPQMWYAAFRNLADEDLAAVVVYLRSRAPVRNPLPVTRVPAEHQAELVVPEPLVEPVALPDLADPAERARYYVRLADCGGCHTSWYTPRNPGFFAGGNPIDRAGGTTFSANITGDPSGIPYYDEALFREVIRTGRVKARELDGAMPWVVFRNLSDEDLDAIFRLLRDRVPPMRHAINNLDPPTECPICGGQHPLGDRNQPVELHPLAILPGLAAELAGRYRFEDGFQIVLSLDGGRLVARVGGETTPHEVFTEDGRRFRVRDQADVLEFRRDAEGRVSELMSAGVYLAKRLPERRAGRPEGE